MEIEHVAGVSFPSGGTANQQGDGTVGHGVLAQVVVNHQHILALVHEMLTHGAAGIGGDVLHGCQLGSGGGHHDGVVHGTFCRQVVHNLSHGGTLLTDGHIDTDHVFPLLVQDGIGGDGGLTGLAVADNQLTLAPSNGNHGVDGLDAGLEGLVYRFPVDDARGRGFDGAVGLGGDGALAVNGLTQGVDNTAQKALTHRHGNHLTGALYRIPLFDTLVVAQDNHGHRILFQILGHAIGTVGEFHQLAGHALVQAGDLGNAVSHQDHHAGFAGFQLLFVVLDLTTDDFRNFFGS